MTKQSNHHAIFRASFLTGGAQVVGLVIGLIRNKVVAVWLGAAGVGFSAMLNQVFGVMQATSTLGIPPAGVRAVALARDDNDAMLLSMRAVRHACFSLAIVVAATFALAAPIISHALFQDYQHAVDILILVLGLIFAQMAAAEQTILRGIGRVGGLAKINVVSAAAGALVTIPMVYFVGQRGIAPSILASSIALYWFSRRASRALPIVGELPSREAVSGKAWSLAKIGAAFFGLTIIGMLLNLGLSVMVQRQEGIAGNGIYQAAVALTVTIANFVLTAMGQDFYPKVVHLMSKGQRHEVAGYCANQVEMGLLMALPVLASVAAFSHELILVAYSGDFHAADPLVGVLAASCWARICYWPHMLCMMAEANPTKILSAELSFAACTVAVAWFALPAFGVGGAACAYAGTFVAYSLVVSWLVRRMTGHFTLGEVWRLYVLGLACIVGGFYLPLALKAPLLLLIYAAVLRRLTANLGPAHRLTRLVLSIPLLRCLVPSKES